MSMINELKMRIKACNNGIIHDSRSDVQTLGKAIMLMQKKINEIVRCINQIEVKEDN